MERNETSSFKKTTRAPTSQDFVGLESARNARKRKSAIVNVRTAKRSDFGLRKKGRFVFIHIRTFK